MAYPNWIYSMSSFIGFMLVTIPLPWHLEAWNTGTCLFMFWTGLACLNQFINSVVWTGNAINWAPVWCDISARIMIGSAVAIPACSLCINRRLYYIATSNSVTTTQSEKRRGIMVDLAIGLGIPIIEMILQYIPQGHRFNIFEDVGCYPFTYNTPVAYALVLCWPIVFGIISLVYCILSIRAFNQRRLQFKELLSSLNNMNSSRYVRLMCLASIEILCTLPLASYGMYLNISAGISPWRGWADTHYGFSRVDQIPAIIWKNDPILYASLESSRWVVVGCALIFFGFFGFADEARKNYRRAVDSVAKRLGYSGSSFSAGFLSSVGSKKPGMTSSAGNSATLPVYVRKVVRKHDSLDSFTNMTASYNGDAYTSDFKGEKSFNDASFGRLSLLDVGGAIADYKPGAPSPSTSDTSSISSQSFPPSYPNSPVKDNEEANELTIEVSSIRRSSAIIVTPPALPEPTLNLANVPRHVTDTPVAVRHSAEIV